MEPPATAPTTTWVLVLGDQLSHASPALAGIDTARDTVLMIEAPGEATHVWSHKARIAIFLAAMRHFRDELRARGFQVRYIELGDSALPSLTERLAAQLAARSSDERPQADDMRRPPLKGDGESGKATFPQEPSVQLRLLEPGEWRLEQDIRKVCAATGTHLRIIDDTHFMCSRADFTRWAQGHGRQLRMEFFYREMRRRHRVLLDEAGGPEGGAWNYDSENRKPYPNAGPGLIPAPERPAPDALTRKVINEVERRFGDHPGSLADFAWPVTRDQALQALQVFIEARLAGFGDHQDAMWTETPFGWHALLSSSLNLHLLDPREVIAAAEAAYRRGAAPLAAAEGFIRQVLGWREFIRGVYWRDMPGMGRANHLKATRQLPAWYWTGETRMACARDAVGQTLRHGYAHHIQRLMVTGLFALLAETEPQQVADWYLAVYVDAVEWAELPNVAGMALYADGGRFTSKPYVASGAYIDRMSDHCGPCHYAPTPKAVQKTGRPHCPFTVLYWHFLDRHEDMLAANPRTALMARNVGRLKPDERARLRVAAKQVFDQLDAL